MSAEKQLKGTEGLAQQIADDGRNPQLTRARAIQGLAQILVDMKPFQEGIQPIANKVPVVFSAARIARDTYRTAKAALINSGNVVGKNEDQRKAYIDDTLQAEMIACHQAENEQSALQAQLQAIDIQSLTFETRAGILKELLQYLPEK